MLRTHRSLKDSRATLAMKMKRKMISFYFIFPSNVVPVEWNWQWKTEVLGEKPVPVLLCPPQIPHGLTRDRTRASAVRGRLLTAWDMALPSLMILPVGCLSTISYLCLSVCLSLSLSPFLVFLILQTACAGISVHAQHFCTRTAFLYTHSISVHPQHFCTRTAFLYTHSISVHAQHFCTRTEFLYTHSISLHAQHFCTRTAEACITPAAVYSFRHISAPVNFRLKISRMLWQPPTLISVFRRDVDVLCSLLGY
jgi:hypothetical protein